MYCDRAASWCDNSSYGRDARHCCPATCGVCQPVQPVCTCANGVAATGDDCTGGEVCESCNEGWMGIECNEVNNYSIDLFNQILSMLVEGSGVCLGP